LAQVHATEENFPWLPDTLLSDPGKKPTT